MGGAALAWSLLGASIAAAVTETGMGVSQQHQNNKAKRSAREHASKERRSAESMKPAQAKQPSLEAVESDGARMRGIQSTIEASRPTQQTLGA